MPRIEPVNHREAATATQIHAVLQLAYTQEAAVLQVKHFAPADRTIEEVQTSSDYFLCAIEKDKIVGAISLGPDDEPNQLRISTLVIHPDFQRRGIGRLLVAEALRRGSGMVFSVATGIKNKPALALYTNVGFVEYRRGTIGEEGLELVKLRKSAP